MNDRRALQVAGEALELAPDARERFLREACPDPELRKAVDTLLGYANDPRDPLAPADPRPTLLTDLEAVGPYRILSRLGGGGTGIVFAAQQTRPDRTVALKLLRTDFAEPETYRRFSREVELLGRLQHEGIARIYDAGCERTPAGEDRPWYAMELVRGLGAIEYAKANDLDLRARLRLVAQIADAVAHAHQIGVVHRDLKPGNILVDAAGQAKVLDFGIARVLDAHAQTDSLRTATGAIVGTVSYMSPEQAAGVTGAIDTPTDVHALGVLAFELIAGNLPYEVEGRPLAQALRTLQQAQPLALGRCAPRTPRDVITIIHKAIEKDPKDRYANAGELGDDIRRFLRDDPILARPPSTAYLAYKFAARNKRGVAAALAFLALLTTATIFNYLEAQRANRAAADAEAARQAEAEKLNAAEQVLAFWSDVVMKSPPNTSGAESVTIAEALKRAENRIEYRFHDKPLAEAGLRYTLGRVHRHLVNLEAAEKHLNRALELFAQEDSIRHYMIGAAHYQLGAIYHSQGRREESIRAMRAAVHHRRRDANPRTTPPSILAEAVNSLALYLHRSGNHAAAEPLYRESLEIHAREGTENTSIAAAQINFGQFLSERNKPKLAIPQFEQARAMLKRIDKRGSTYDIVAANNLAIALRHLGHLDPALEQHDYAVTAGAQRFGESHPSLATLKLSYSDALLEAGRIDAALQQARASLAIRTKLRQQLKSRGDQLIANAEERVALALLRLGKLAEARRSIDHALTLAPARLAKIPNTRRFKKLDVLARLLVAEGAPDKAVALARSTLIAMEQRVDPGEPKLASYVCTLCEALQCVKDRQRLEPAVLRLRQLMEKMPVAPADLELRTRPLLHNR